MSIGCQFYTFRLEKAAQGVAHCEVSATRVVVDAALRRIGFNNVSLVTRAPRMTTAERAGPSFELPFSQKGTRTAFRSSEKEPEQRSGAFRLHWSPAYKNLLQQFTKVIASYVT